MKQNLFNFTGTAKARNSDPETSHMAADRMNTGNRLGMQQRAVLRAIHYHDGHTAKELGVIMEKLQTGSHSFPHKRCRELEGKLFIIRQLLPGERELRNYITDLGRNFLKSQ